jgi:predicted nucleic acid-binding protein
LDRIYVDTNFLIDAVIGRNEEKSIQQSELDKIMNSSMQVCIPQIILGESFAIISRNSNHNDLHDNIAVLVEWIQRLVPEADISTCMPSISSEIFRMAEVVRERDSRKEGKCMDWNDAVFISHAFLDQHARVVCTTDGRIQNSELISEFNDERKDKGWPGLSVRDSVAKRKKISRTERGRRRRY